MRLGHFSDRVTQLADWFIPADMAANREQREKARIFLYSHIFGPFIGNSVPLSVAIFDKTIDYRVIVLSASISSFWLFPPLLRAIGHYYLLSVLSVQTLIFCILWSCYCYGGLSSPTVAWILTIPILAFMYVGHSTRMRAILFAQFAINTLIYYVICKTITPPEVTLAQWALQVFGLVSTAAASLYTTMMAFFYANALASQTELQTEIDQHLVTAADLLAATEEARRSGTAKSDFIARMSHELRAPLNAIIGYSEMMLEDAEIESDPTTISDISRIRDAGHYLLKLVNKILDLSRLEAGRMEITNEWVDCNELVNSVIREVEPLAAKNGNKLCYVKEGEPGQIAVDTLKLKQALAHILENAAQYSSKGTITVTARREPAAGDDQITISVADSGPGIARDRLPYLLNSFETLDEDDNRSNGGAGLGLALSKKLCDLVNARLSVESELGRGSVFKVTLSAKGAASSAGAANDSSELAEDVEESVKAIVALASALRAEREKSKGSFAYAKAAVG